MFLFTESNYSINTAVEMTTSVFSPQRLLNGFTIEGVFIQADYFLCVAICKVEEEFVDARIAEFRDVVEKAYGQAVQYLGVVEFPSYGKDKPSFSDLSFSGYLVFIRTGLP